MHDVLWWMRPYHCGQLADEPDIQRAVVLDGPHKIFGATGNRQLEREHLVVDVPEALEDHAAGG